MSTTTTSTRIDDTLDPCVVLMKQLIVKHEQVWKDKGEHIYSLAQGVVYWKPPDTVKDSIVKAITDTDSTSMLHMYAPDEGLPELREALQEKLRVENNLENVDVMITSGANQAYMNCVLTLLDEQNDDLAIVFRPYYFNHVMAIQMTRGDDALLIGPVDDLGCPDVVWLKEQLLLESSKSSSSSKNIKMITITNPGNPTGVSIPRHKLKEIVDLCQEYNKWLVLDCTYEQFDHTDVNVHNDNGFHCFSEPHVLNIFSFSKGYAMAGYRVGYVAINTSTDKGKHVFEQMVKVQDTIPICTSRISQQAALGALQAGRTWVLEKVQTLDSGREAIMDALAPLEKTIGGSGAMYVMAKLPDGMDDMEFAESLIEKFGLAVIPGKFCGLPGWIRVCYSNLPPKDCQIAAERLKRGLAELCDSGSV